ncbi:2,3-bisphosphoglycerate-dependent phosphoglycerate mutase [Scopulibacillus daqui]|uniref:2,3-bisphosphoglycerate-dependent phosphoglycerate mutase n=1 Tax=Scopulibacillus daqui TaxID=1469162 RepID=A0ABS2PZV3_9BACL|nr:histidine phosphatase family protein [Scopulibacillus daqui]MBM7645586.1 2,3-bisphosphoglycerate-dependent phosphoglycerate mutase [Scopulibacillus daqui]
MRKKIYLIRHCKAEGQPPDAPLTKEGHLDAERLGQYLSRETVDGIYSSPFLRARQTILPLSKQLNMSVHTDRRLSEKVLSTRDLPDWYEQLRRSFADMSLKLEGGESSQEATARAIDCIDDILKMDGKTYVVVTHGCLMALMLKHYDSNFGFKEWEGLANPDIFQLHFEDAIATKITRVWNKDLLFLEHQDGIPDILS